MPRDRANRGQGKSTKGDGGSRMTASASYPRRPSAGVKEKWLREYYIPDYSIQRAARDLISHSVTEEIEDFAGRMFALQDLIDNHDLENISALEEESDSPFFLTITAAVRKEAPIGDPEYARSIAGEFIEEAFRQDSATVRLWQRYQNRMRQRRLDAGLGFIDPPDRRYDSESSTDDDDAPERTPTDDATDSPTLGAATLEVGTLKVKKLKVKTLMLS